MVFLGGLAICLLLYGQSVLAGPVRTTLPGVAEELEGATDGATKEFSLAEHDIQKQIEELVKARIDEIMKKGDEEWKTRIMFFGAGAAATLIIGLVISACYGLVWHKCRYKPEHLERPSGQSNPNYYNRPLAKIPDEYGFEEYETGGWEFQEDDNVYYSVPFDEEGAQNSMPDKAKKGGDDADEAEDEMEIMENAIYNVEEGAIGQDEDEGEDAAPEGPGSAKATLENQPKEGEYDRAADVMNVCETNHGQLPVSDSVPSSYRVALPPPPPPVAQTPVLTPPSAPVLPPPPVGGMPPPPPPCGAVDESQPSFNAVSSLWHRLGSVSEPDYPAPMSPVTSPTATAAAPSITESLMKALQERQTISQTPSLDGQLPGTSTFRGNDVIPDLGTSAQADCIDYDDGEDIYMNTDTYADESLTKALKEREAISQKPSLGSQLQGTSTFRGNDGTPDPGTSEDIYMNPDAYEDDDEHIYGNV